jgi:transposase-like protein
MRAEVLVGPERRRRWTAEEKLRIVREAFEPGRCVAEIARRRDVSRSQIYQWRVELRDDRPNDVGNGLVGFVPVEVTAAATLGARSPAAAVPHVIEIGLASGRVLKVPSSLPTPVLRRLIRAVESA